ncbi:uncharacterized protein [Montipora foliosa]|uniref:uncharacterized protein n=1 Tax=Montipora foliosa TaxID=591990 RepID=UPI0035F1E61A
MRKPRTSQYKEVIPPAINALVLSNKKERETSLLFQASGEAGWVIYQSTASRYGLAMEVPVTLLRFRKVAIKNSEPKSFKPRHPPKPVVKKTKKSKENEKEDSVERSGNQDGYKSDNESTETKEDMKVDDAVSESKNDDASYRPTTNAHVLNMPEGGGETPSKGSNPGGSWLSKEPLATIQNGVHAQTKENQTKATDAGTAKDEGGPQEETPALSTHKATEGNRAKTQLGGKTIVWNTEEEIQNEDQNSAFAGTNGNNGETLKTQRSESFQT